MENPTHMKNAKSLLHENGGRNAYTRLNAPINEYKIVMMVACVDNLEGSKNMIYYDISDIIIIII
jgi:hypothetical protein